MILSAFAWWVASSVLGLLAFPVAYRALGRLPDRGYGASRALGLLAGGYGLWLSASIGLLRNDLGGALTAVVILAGLGGLAGRGRWREIIAWIRAQRWSILAMELVFLGAYVLWAIVRANDPDISHTEQPMDLAFLASILRSRTFPPADPWLSGYAISYYYFGYVLLAFLARLTGTAAGVAFNLGNVLWFALTALGTYSLLYNLLAHRYGKPRPLASLLGPAFVLISGNLEGVLEVLHARHLFWRTLPDGTMTSRFWTWLGLPDLVRPPVAPPSWIPSRFWMWWRASRVVNDYTLTGAHVEVIDEFPYFSFLLADNHPHLLAIPFVLLGITFTLQLFLTGRREAQHMGRRPVEARTLRQTVGFAAIALLVLAVARTVPLLREGVPALEVMRGALTLIVIGGLAVLLLGGLILLLLGNLPSFLNRTEFGLAAWLFGGLAFLNTWDFPVYLSLLLAVGWWMSRDSPPGETLRRVAFTGAGLVTAGVLFYLPWYPTFASQAGGVLPNLAFPTRLTHFLLMFGTMIVPIAAWLLWKAVQRWQRPDGSLVARVAIGIPGVLLLLSWALALVIGFLRPDMVGTTVEEIGAQDTQQALQAILSRRLTTSWTALLLGGVLALSVLLLRRRHRPAAGSESRSDALLPYVAFLSGIGALLVLGPEFLYLKDLFGTRINTVFKFYFAAWMLWGLAAAYVAVELWDHQGRWRGLMRAVAVTPLILGFAYTLTATWNKTGGFNPIGDRTLDGTVHLARENPDDYAAIQWMQANLKDGVIAEAVGGSFHPEYGRISAHTGLPTVLGWPWHEVQWRGSDELVRPREADIRRLYETPEWPEAKAVLDQYGISYVVVGNSERAAYPGLIERKFEAFMQMIYSGGGVKIYAVPGAEQSP